MRLNVVRTIGLLLFVGVLMPVGMLFGINTYQPPAVTSSNANWYDVEEATNLLNQMQTLAVKTRREVARLQVQELQLDWEAQAGRLEAARSDVNTMGSDLVRLDQVKSKLEPWQQSLVNKVTPKVHEMVYQLDAAIAKINAHQNRTYLAMTQYPQNINMIYKNANRMAGTISTVSQYAQAEQKMAALEHPKAKVNS